MPPALTTDQIKLIDRALVEIGDFGEVRLIIEKGQLKFIQQLTSIAVVVSAPRPASAPTATFQPWREHRT